MIYYLTQNDLIHDFQENMDSPEDGVINTVGSKVVVGDVSARTLKWVMLHMDAQG